MQKILRMGTRRSRLSLVQAGIVLDSLNRQARIIQFTTQGDKSKAPLQDLGTGVFTRQLDSALLDNEIDLAVHSLKDIPTEMPQELHICAVVQRADPRDSLVGTALNGLKKGSVVGTSSSRRSRQLKDICPDMEIKPIRGNVDTRIKKIGKDYDAAVFAKAGLDRIGLDRHISYIFPVMQMVPAAGQGAIAVVKRRSDRIIIPGDKALYTACGLEREFIRNLGGCREPVGAYCTHKDNIFVLRGMVYTEGRKSMPKFTGTGKQVKQEVRKWKKEHL